MTVDVLEVFVGIAVVLVIGRGLLRIARRRPDQAVSEVWFADSPLDFLLIAVVIVGSFFLAR